MKPITMLNGRIVRNFDFTPHVTRAPYAQMAGAVKNLGAFVDAGLSHFREIAASRDLTHSGREKAYRAWFAANGAPLKAAHDSRTLAAAQRVENSGKIKSLPVTVDPHLAAEIRAGHKALSVGQRTAKFHSEDGFDNRELSVLADAPWYTTGFSEQQHVRIKELAIRRANPGVLKEDERLVAGSDCVGDTMRAAIGALSKASGITESEICELGGVPGHAERMATIMSALPRDDAAA